jgi:hypothetical protein
LIFGKKTAPLGSANTSEKTAALSPSKPLGFQMPSEAPGSGGPWALPKASSNVPPLTAADLGTAIKTGLDGMSVKLDGQKVGRLVSARQGDAAAKPSTGPSNFDSRLSPLGANMVLNPG